MSSISSVQYLCAGPLLSPWPKGCKCPHPAEARIRAQRVGPETVVEERGFVSVGCQVRSMGVHAAKEKVQSAEERLDFFALDFGGEWTALHGSFLWKQVHEGMRVLPRIGRLLRLACRGSPFFWFFLVLSWFLRVYLFPEARKLAPRRAGKARRGRCMMSL